MRPIKSAYMKPAITTYRQLVNEMKEYAQAMEPYKERFHKFISANPCSDIPMVPNYDIHADTIYDIQGNAVKIIPVSVSDYNLEFPTFTNSKNPNNEQDTAEGALYQAEIYNYHDDVEYRFFILPDAYVEDPDAWEKEVLRLSEIRESIADAAIKAVLPNAPKEAKKESLYTFDINDPLPDVEKGPDRILIRLNPEYLPAKGEPNYQALYSYNSLFVTLATGEVSTLSELIPGAIPSFKGIEKVGF